MYITRTTFIPTTYRSLNKQVLLKSTSIKFLSIQNTGFFKALMRICDRDQNRVPTFLWEYSEKLFVIIIMNNVLTNIYLRREWTPWVHIVKFLYKLKTNKFASYNTYLKCNTNIWCTTKKEQKWFVYLNKRRTIQSWNKKCPQNILSKTLLSRTESFIILKPGPWQI